MYVIRGSWVGKLLSHGRMSMVSLHVIMPTTQGAHWEVETVDHSNSLEHVNVRSFSHLLVSFQCHVMSVHFHISVSSSYSCPCSYSCIFHCPIDVYFSLFNLKVHIISQSCSFHFVSCHVTAFHSIHVIH